jgi:hypothetical protein
MLALVAVGIAHADDVVRSAAPLAARAERAAVRAASIGGRTVRRLVASNRPDLTPAPTAELRRWRDGDAARRSAAALRPGTLDQARRARGGRRGWRSGRVRRWRPSVTRSVASVCRPAGLPVERGVGSPLRARVGIVRAATIGVGQAGRWLILAAVSARASDAGSERAKHGDGAPSPAGHAFILARIHRTARTP